MTSTRASLEDLIINIIRARSVIPNSRIQWFQRRSGCQEIVERSIFEQV